MGIEHISRLEEAAGVVGYWGDVPPLPGPSVQENYGAPGHSLSDPILLTCAVGVTGWEAPPGIQSHA